MLGKNIKVTGKVKKLYFQKVFIVFKTVQRMCKNEFSENIYTFSFIYLAKIKSSKAEYLGKMLQVSQVILQSKLGKKSGFSSIIFLK